MKNLPLYKKAFLAKLAYEPEIDIITKQIYIMFGVGFLDIRYIYVERTDTEGFVFRKDNDCFIYFSGTESLKDLFHDLIFLPSRYHDGFIHSGFNKIFKSIEKPLIEAVQDLFGDEPIEKIHAGGHSLGSSICMGACDILYFDKCINVPMEITTFGCPNGWSRGARKGFDKRHPDITNYINPFDYVTYMLGITTGRPGKDVKLSGKWGHFMEKYIANVKDV